MSDLITEVIFGILTLIGIIAPMLLIGLIISTDDIVKRTMNFSKTEKKWVKKYYFISLYGGVAIIILGIIVVILKMFIEIPLSGYSVIGLGIVILSYYFTNVQILNDDTATIRLQEKIYKLEENLIPPKRIFSSKQFLNQKSQARKILFYAWGLFMCGIAILILSIFMGSSLLDLVSIGVTFLIFVVMFEQGVINDIEKTQMDERLNRIEVFTKKCRRWPKKNIPDPSISEKFPVTMTKK